MPRNGATTWTQSASVVDGQAVLHYTLTDADTTTVVSSMNPAEVADSSYVALRSALTLDVLNTLVRVLGRHGIDISGLVAETVTELGYRVLDTTPI